MQSLTRRDLLDVGVRGSIAMWLALMIRGSARAAIAADRKFKMDLRCSSIGVDANPRTRIALADQYGFESVTPAPKFLATLTDVQNSALAAKMQEMGLGWGAAGLPVSFNGEEAAFESGIRQLPALASAMQCAGVTRVGTWISPSHSTLTYSQNFRLHTVRLRECGRILGQHGLRLGFEYIGPKTLWASERHPFIHTMAETKELISEIGLDNVGFVLDSWHWYTVHETVDDLLTLTNDDIVACDLNDAPDGVPVDEQIDSRRELPAATGVINVKGFLEALMKIGYDGPIRAEPFNRQLDEMDNDQAVAATAAAMKKAFALGGIQMARA